MFVGSKKMIMLDYPSNYSRRNNNTYGLKKDPRYICMAQGWHLMQSADGENGIHLHRNPVDFQRRTLQLDGLLTDIHSSNLT